MTRIVVFPHLKAQPNQRTNPYIDDYVQAINALPGCQVVNPPHKNPLLSLLPPSRWADVYIFNWFESIPDSKYGPLQTVIATLFVQFMRLRRRKIVWMLHNKRPHATGHEHLKRFLARFIARMSTLIVTHSEEGLRLVAETYPHAVAKTHFLHHPTKCRLAQEAAATEEKKYHLLVWGTIARYKGVFQWVEYLRQHPEHDLRVCIVGGASEADYQALEALNVPGVTIVRQRPSFSELSRYVAQSEFVLCPYNPESVLSSGMLMDSLSFGAKVIGPDTGSFHDYAQPGQPVAVYTFRTFQDIPHIVECEEKRPVKTEAYRRFLTENDWTHFAQALSRLLNLPTPPSAR